MNQSLKIINKVWVDFQSILTSGAFGTGRPDHQDQYRHLGRWYFISNLVATCTTKTVIKIEDLECTDKSREKRNVVQQTDNQAKHWTWHAVIYH